MKNLIKIIPIVILIILIFVFNKEILSFKDNLKSYLNNNHNITVLEKENTSVVSKINLPGALRRTVNTIINNNVKLSKDNIIVLTNKNREDNGGLVPLIENEKLNLSAEKKLNDMFESQYFEHISSDGIGVSDIGKEVGYDYILIGENLAMGNFKNDEDLLGAWMASPGHRANILNNKYRDIGVAVGKGSFEGNDIWMAVSHFGNSIDVCNSIDNTLYEMINNNQKDINNTEEDMIIRKKMIKDGVIYEGSSIPEQIKKYNELVNIYNYLLKKVKEEINKYNNQVNTFNNCVKDNQ